MSPLADTFDLGQLALSSGEGRSIELAVALEPLVFGDETYAAGGPATARLDVARMTSGHSLRLRFEQALHGPCMRCLEDANATVKVDAREVDHPGGGEDLSSPYLHVNELDLRAWARDALALAVPTQIFCREDCRGLCPECGANLNKDPAHSHEAEPDPRWAKLSELKFD